MSAYPGHYPRPLPLGESSPDWHPVGICSVKRRAQPGLLRSCGSFGVSLDVRLFTGFRGGEPWSLQNMSGPYSVPFWASPLVRVGLFTLTMVQMSVRMTTHRYLLAGVPSQTPGDPHFTSRIEDQSLPWG